MKPIEPGCLAIVISASGHPHLVGKKCRVIGLADPVWKFPERTWDVDLFDGRNDWCGHESELMRIDDYDPSTEETKSDREVTA